MTNKQAEQAHRSCENELGSVKKANFFVETFKSLSKNRLAVVGMCIIIMLVLLAIFADVVAPYTQEQQDLKNRFLTPCREHLFGTDNLGRDIFSRILYGSRISLAIGACAALFGASAGTVFGAIAGFYGGKVENIIMRCIDVLMAIPNTLMAISILAALGPGLKNTILAVSLCSIPRYARIVRASVLSVKGSEYVEAAQSIGASDRRIIARHILPNCLAPIIVQVTMGVATSILMAASLSFIGLGVQPPTAEWGAMLSAARPYIRDHWHMVLFPGLAIMVTILGLNIFGDGLRDALDPRLRN